MDLHFDQELAQLKEALLRMSALAEQSVSEAFRSLVRRDDALAEKVDVGDATIDNLHIEIDDRCVQLIALRQPKARDLRFIVMTIKIAAELERIGDQAVNIAHRAAELRDEPRIKLPADIPRLAEIAQGMIREALDAFVRADPEAAHRVIQRDDEMDALHQQSFHALNGLMREDPQALSPALKLMGIAHNLERIGDHAVNIAEDVVYLYEAHDIRHQHR